MPSDHKLECDNTVSACGQTEQAESAKHELSEVILCIDGNEDIAYFHAHVDKMMV